MKWYEYLAVLFWLMFIWSKLYNIESKIDKIESSYRLCDYQVATSSNTLFVSGYQITLSTKTIMQ